MTLPLRALLALASGCAVAGSFWPLPLGVVTAPVLLLAGMAGFITLLHESTPKRGVLVGFSFGIGFMALLVEWLRVLGSDAWLLVAVMSALFYALFGWAYVRLRDLPGAPVLVTAAWVAIEFARTQVPLGGFPWGRLVFAVEETPLVHFTRWVGVAATSGIIFAVAWCIAAAIRRGGIARFVGPVVAVAVSFGLGALLPIGIAGGGSTVTVAAVQGDVPGTGAQSLGQQHEVTTNHALATRELAAAVAAGTQPEPDLVIWPENSTDIDPFENPSVGATISEAVDTIDVPTLVGVILDGPGPREARNVGLVWQPGSGPDDQIYVKRHLVPFGEYIPFRSIVAKFVQRLDQIPRDMVPGDEPGVLQVGPATVGTMMCFDVAYDDVIRGNVMAGAQLLVVQTNNATYNGSVQPEQQWAISRVRAVETGRNLVVASVNGISGMVAADGSVIDRTYERDRQVLVDSMQLGHGVTWGVRVGPWVEWAATLVALAGLVATGSGASTGRGPHRTGVPCANVVGTGDPRADAELP